MGQTKRYQTLQTSQSYHIESETFICIECLQELQKEKK